MNVPAGSNFSSMPIEFLIGGLLRILFPDAVVLLNNLRLVIPDNSLTGTGLVGLAVGPNDDDG